jgi:hypothetical protein
MAVEHLNVVNGKCLQFSEGGEHGRTHRPTAREYRSARHVMKTPTGMRFRSPKIRAERSTG